MEFKKYIIRDGDTLKSIAEECGLSVSELLDFHNFLATMTQQIFGDHIPLHINEFFIPLHKKISEKKTSDNIKSEHTEKYRCEQTVVTKLNGIPTNTAKTKREFLIRKFLDDQNIFVEVKILDNIIEINPTQYQEAIDLVSELDNIKCDGIILKVNDKTGEIEKVINHTEIIGKWEKHKNLLESKYDFIRDSNAKESMRMFMDIAGKQIRNEKTLIEDVKMKMFFEILFNKYLVNAADKMEQYSRNVYSQLFEGEIIQLNIRQDLLRESEDQILMRKVSSINDGVKKSSHFEKKYDEKYRPVLHYKFSEYNASFRERVVYNEKLHLPEEGEVTIIEEVKNNIQLLVNYNFRKIE